jgi:nitrogen regulatory protein PII
MKRITVLLKSSEATPVRKAIAAAGGERTMVAHAALRACSLELADWYCGPADATGGHYSRLDALVQDDRADAVMSAILATARTGMIERVVSLQKRVEPTPVRNIRPVRALAAAM